MRRLAAEGDPDLVRRTARAVGRELAAIGFDLDFAPVLDVDTNPANPVIGDRAFGTSADAVSRLAIPFALGLQDAGVLACGKHFPGHGDTHLDSHLALPTVAHDRARLDEVELPPFAAAARAGVRTMMTAHVVCTALDANVPATLSRRALEDVLRGELGFEGVLFSDDLEMKAVADRAPVEQTAVEAIAAGCDVLLVCRDEDAQDRCHAALVREAERSPAFLARCAEAAERALAARRAVPPTPAATLGALREAVGGAESRAIADELARRLGGA
jgi:beta-N-acetylhexosaminidase